MQCPVCFVQFEQVVELTDHVRSHKKTYDFVTVTDDGSIQCLYCMKTFKKMMTYNHHAKNYCVKIDQKPKLAQMIKTEDVEKRVPKKRGRKKKRFRNLKKSASDESDSDNENKKSNETEKDSEDDSPSRKKRKTTAEDSSKEGEIDESNIKTEDGTPTAKKPPKKKPEKPVESPLESEEEEELNEIKNSEKQGLSVTPNIGTPGRMATRNSLRSSARRMKISDLLKAYNSRREINYSTPKKRMSKPARTPKNEDYSDTEEVTSRKKTSVSKDNDKKSQGKENNSLRVRKNLKEPQITYVDLSDESEYEEKKKKAVRTYQNKKLINKDTANESNEDMEIAKDIDAKLAKLHAEDDVQIITENKSSNEKSIDSEAVEKTAEQSKKDGSEEILSTETNTEKPSTVGSNKESEKSSVAEISDKNPSIVGSNIESEKSSVEENSDKKADENTEKEKEGAEKITETTENSKTTEEKGDKTIEKISEDKNNEKTSIESEETEKKPTKDGEITDKTTDIQSQVSDSEPNEESGNISKETAEKNQSVDKDISSESQSGAVKVKEEMETSEEEREVENTSDHTLDDVEIKEEHEDNDYETRPEEESSNEDESEDTEDVVLAKRTTRTVVKTTRGRRKARTSKHELRQCHLCPRTFFSEVTLGNHLRGYHSDAPKECKVCFKTFPTYERLKSHQSVHKPRKFLCVHCGKALLSKGHLIVHVRTHTQERPYVCEDSMCRKTFITKAALIIHIRTHTGEKPYICQLCDKRFTHITGLKQHYIAHSGVKKHICEVCNKSFAFRGRYTEHMRTHADKKPFPCVFCDKGFITGKQLRNHLFTHDKNFGLQCDLCDELFRGKLELKKHLTIEHELEFL